MADAQDSKSCGGDLVWVQVPPSALNERQKNPEMAAFPGFFIWRYRMLKEKAAVITGGVSMSVSGLNTELYTSIQ